jgi:hypothetical protein
MSLTIKHRFPSSFEILVGPSIIPITRNRASTEFRFLWLDGILWECRRVTSPGKDADLYCDGKLYARCRRSGQSFVRAVSHWTFSDADATLTETLSQNPFWRLRIDTHHRLVYARMTWGRVRVAVRPSQPCLIPFAVAALFRYLAFSDP